MKYLIVKGGPCGFGDRLQCLKMCVKYALIHNLQIYVDWEDPIWSHSGENFYTYFKLVNIPVLNSIDDIPEDATIYPPCWKGKLKEHYTDEIAIESMIGYIQDETFDADVIVYPSSGFRYIYADSEFFANVFRLIDPRIIQKVKERQHKYDLKNKIGIHLRGTDRATKIDKTHRMAGMNIRMVGMGLLNGKKFIAVSDDPEFIKLWNVRYNEFPLLTEVRNLGGSQGFHTRSKDTLTTTKDVLNVDMLVDFFTLASCSNIISTSKDSRFAQEAHRLSKYISKIIN